MEDIVDINSLETGDIILCHSSGPGGSRDKGLDGWIEFATHSPWEHVGIIIRNPWWIESDCLCILQSGSGPNTYGDIMNDNRCGVTLNYLSDFLCNRSYIYTRKLENFKLSEQTKKNFYEAFKVTHGKPYDSKPLSWCGVGIGSFFGCKCCSKAAAPRTTETFWCSALVAYMYVQMGWLNENLDWSCQTPEDMAIAIATEPFRLGVIKRLNYNINQ